MKTTIWFIKKHLSRTILVILILLLLPVGCTSTETKKASVASKIDAQEIAHDLSNQNDQLLILQKNKGDRYRKLTYLYSKEKVLGVLSDQPNRIIASLI